MTDENKLKYNLFGQKSQFLILLLRFSVLMDTQVVLAYEISHEHTDFPNVNVSLIFFIDVDAAVAGMEPSFHQLLLSFLPHLALTKLN